MNRALDAAAAGLGLAVASPILAAAALAIKLDDRGPVFYRQRRVGLNGEEFELVKLRTMEVGAERKGAGFAVNEGDPRITRAGRHAAPAVDRRAAAAVERRARRHEPRSAPAPRSRIRSSATRLVSAGVSRCRPGITGWAQIHGRARLPWDERIELDVWYVEHRSPWLDLKIIARTPRALFAGTYKGDTGGWSTMIPFFNGAQVREAVSPERALEAVREAFIAYARGEWTMPPKVYVPAYPEGDFRAMPALGGGPRTAEVGDVVPGQSRAGTCRPSPGSCCSPTRRTGCRRRCSTRAR